MKKSFTKILLALFMVVFMLITTVPSLTSSSAATTPKSVLYAMNYLSPETSTTTTLNDIKGSGFDTVIIFSIDGTATGDLVFFGTPIFTNGNYVGPAGWPDKIKSLKTGTTSVTRVAFCLAGPYTTYKTYMNANGTGPETNWYKNFAKLKELTGADAIDLNDENGYDTPTTVSLCRMLGTIGYKVTLCPYTRSSHWSSVYSQVGSSIIDGVNLQCYDGGAYNSPATWNTYFGGLKVTPLFWTVCPSGGDTNYVQAQTKVANWVSSAGITSAGAWQYSDMRDFSGGTAAQYNAAIRAGLGSTTPTPTPTPNPNPGNRAFNKTATANAYVTGETPALAVDGSVTNNSKWCTNSNVGAQWLRVDLGATYAITRWVVKHAGAGGEATGYNTKDFKLQISTDGTNWQDVDSVTGNTANITDRTVSSVNARYVRLYITNPQTTTTNIAARIYELEIY